MTTAIPGTSPRRTSSIPYQPALDGLRGAAVAGVLLFHGGHLTGGYLGVDAFFVLSGYLITSLLLQEVATTGTVSLLAFWGRRLRRLLPALVLVLLAVAVYAAVVNPVDQLHTIRADAFATLGYVANWRQVLIGNDYWAIFGAPSPLQHTWSLAIEEQFYLVWPVLMLVLNRGRSGVAAARRTLALSVGLALGSFVTMQVLAAADNTRIYYGTDTRAASILIGAALAAWVAIRPRWTSAGSRRALEGAALGAAVFLVVAWTRLDGASAALARGGLFASAVATAVIIAAATRPRRGPVAHVLSIAPLRMLGVISYGVYLWHWPIYIVSRRGAYAATKACLVHETREQGCRRGRIPIRTGRGPDAGVHLCPTGLPPGSGAVCAGYSSGEVRLARAVVNALTSSDR